MKRTLQRSVAVSGVALAVAAGSARGETSLAGLNKQSSNSRVGQTFVHSHFLIMKTLHEMKASGRKEATQSTMLDTPGAISGER